MSSCEQSSGHRGNGASTRRDFLTSALSLPMAAAVGYLYGQGSFAWADEVPPTSGDSPLAEKLHAEYAEECQVYWRYLGYATRAKEDGHPNLARLFRAAAEAEHIHAAALLFVMGAVRETGKNLKASADYEKFLASEVLPKSIDNARKKQDHAAASVLQKFLDASLTHEQAFREGLAALASGGDMGDVPISICPVCGAVVLGEAAEQCSVCRTPKAMFIAVK